MKTWDSAFEAELVKAQDYRAFLRLFFQRRPHAKNWHHPRPISYQEFADRAGFASKGFMSDVLSGRKRLSRESFEKVKIGLKLNSHWADYLKCLLALEEPNFRLGKHDEAYYRLKIESLRHKFIKKKSIQNLKGNSPLSQTILEVDFAEVYASLGSLDSGATLAEICARSRLPESRAILALEAMEKAGFTHKDPASNRYLPVTLAIEAEGLESSAFFQQDFLRSIEKSRKRFAHQARSDQALFMTQTFSVHSKHLPTLRETLSRLIASFADDAEAEEGDAIAEICIAFTHTT